MGRDGFGRSDELFRGFGERLFFPGGHHSHFRQGCGERNQFQARPDHALDATGNEREAAAGLDREDDATHPVMFLGNARFPAHAGE